MWISYYDHDTAELRRNDTNEELVEAPLNSCSMDLQHVGTDAPHIVPDSELCLPIHEKEASATRGNDALDDLTAIADESQATTIRGHLETMCANVHEHLVADVKAGVREEVSVVLMAVESFQSQMVERLSWFESQLPESTKKPSQSLGFANFDHIALPFKSADDVMEYDPLEESSVEDKSESASHQVVESCGLEVDGRTLSSTSLPRMPSLVDTAMQLAGTDLQTSLLASKSMHGSYQPLTSLETTTDKVVHELRKSIQVLQDKEDDISKDFSSWESLWRERHCGLEKDLSDVRMQKEEKQRRLDEALEPPRPQTIPPGPASLSWIDSNEFGNISMMVIALNLFVMIVEKQHKQFAAVFFMCDQVFLAFYTLELYVKFAYYRRTLLCGHFSIVSWNWLDLCIVISGIIDQWLLRALACFLNLKSAGINFSFFRLLRLFRILRALRFLRMLFSSDMSWAEGRVFRSFMLAVISVNSVVMSLELDIAWDGWRWIEHLFLIVYSFELMVRLKRNGRKFFHMASEGVVWNYLDLVMVVGGSFDLWFLPFFYLVESFFHAVPAHEPYFIKEASIFLKILRLVRVLRLVRLMREVKPLYVLLTGVWDSFKAMQYVLVLTLLILYACAIIFTDLVGKGYMYGDAKVPALAETYFGSVGTSMFSLFKVMNGDSDVVEPITGYLSGQLLFVSFMVISNWSILAILTSVVSDHMISASTSQTKQDEEKKKEEDFRARAIRLVEVFKKIDEDGSGYVNKDEWDKMMEDKTLSEELCNASNLELKDLHEFFRFLSHDARSIKKSRLSGSGEEAGRADRHLQGRCINYSIFMRALKDEREYATKRSILHMLSHLRHIEEQLHLIEEIVASRESESWRGAGSRRASIPTSDASSGLA